MKHIIFAISLVLFLSYPGTVFAGETVVAEHSAKIESGVQEPDVRAEKLQNFLATHNSPLKNEAVHFITEADRLSLDWKLVAAIAGVESTFGHRIPTNSYNAWGWGVFTGQSDGIHFQNWADGITKVSEGLRYRYVDRGAKTIEQIGRTYAVSGTWSNKVRYFVNKIDTFVLTDPQQLQVEI